MEAYSLNRSLEYIAIAWNIVWRVQDENSRSKKLVLSEV
jgi:hypothetical protein